MSNTSIDFASFTQTILKELQERLGTDYTVFSHCTKKNNGLEMTGIVVRRAGHSTSPAIYINSFYREDITGEEIKKVAETLYHEFREAEFEDDLDLSDFALFEKAKDRVAFKLIHAGKNKELLNVVPHRLFHNLAIVFYYTMQEAPFYGKATILIRDSHMKHWGTNVKELMHLALQNTPILFPDVINDITDVMREILSESLKQDITGARMGEKENTDLLDEEWFDDLIGQISEDTGREKIPMYVLTNRQKLYGAACMLYPEVLKNFAEKMRQDFYILPSSVHEVILVPANAGTNQESLREIVTDINRTQVAEEEVLADSVYFYSRSRDKILWLS